MTIDDRGSDAAKQLHQWVPAGEAVDVRDRARRRTRARRVGAIGGACVLAAVIVAGVATRGDTDGQRVDVASVPTTIRRDVVEDAAGTSEECSENDLRLVMFLEIDTPPDVIASIGSQLSEDERYTDLRYLDARATLDLYRQILQKEEGIDDAQPGELPTSFWMKAGDGSDRDTFFEDWRGAPFVYKVSERCSTEYDMPQPVGQTIGDLTFDITVTSRCSDYVRGSGSAREACPAPVLSTDTGIYVSLRRAGDPPTAPPLAELGEGQEFPAGSYVATASVMLIDWGCSASSEFAFTVTGAGEDRSVVVESINSRTVDREPIVGAPSKISLTMRAAETFCTGGRPEGTTTSVRVFADLTAEANGVAVDGASVSIVDLENGNALIGGWDLGDEPYPVFMSPGSYGLVFSATGSSCPDGRYTGGTRLVVGGDGSLTLGDPTNPDDAVPEPVTVPAPAATPTLIPDDLVATIQLRPSCMTSGG